MYCILREDIALRSWQAVNRAYYVRGETIAHGLGKPQYEIMCMADGLHDIPESPELKLLVDIGVVKPCEKGAGSLSDWQRLKKYENRYFPFVHWMITGKCNYNCLHCFNCADNAPLMEEFSWEEAVRLMDEMRDCGVHGVGLTGGEPMLHPRFLDIVKGIHDRGMFVDKILTNGHFISQEKLDFLRELNEYPLMKISFDGIGHHDWMRSHRGAEADTLRAIRLCVENGFPVTVQYNLNHRTKDKLLDTACLLDEMGVDALRILRTSESPRWKENADGMTLSMTEWHDFALDFMKAYAAGKHRMKAIMWMICHLDPEEKTFRLRPVRCSAGQYNEKLPMCQEVRRVACISADGSLYPCMQAGVYLNQLGMELGNVKTSSLRSLLTEGPFIDLACASIGAFVEGNSKCRDCQHVEFCAGGCRVCAMYLTGNPKLHDPHKCFFFENGYYDKFVDALPGYENLTEIR